MLEFANTYDFEFIVLIQATSPLLTTEYLDQGIMKILSTKVDSVLWLSGKRDLFGRRWFIAQTGKLLSGKRPAGRSFPDFWWKTGHFILLRGAVVNFPVPDFRESGRDRDAEETYYELDEPKIDRDRTVTKNRLRGRFTLIKDKAKRIRMVLTDCDGVLTDGGMYYSKTAMS